MRGTRRGATRYEAVWRGTERYGAARSGMARRGAVWRDASRVLVGRETLENPGYAKHRKTALQARTLGGTRN